MQHQRKRKSAAHSRLLIIGGLVVIVVIVGFLEGQEEALRASPMSIQYMKSSETQGLNGSSRGGNSDGLGGERGSLAKGSPTGKGSTSTRMGSTEQKTEKASGRFWDLVQGVTENDDGENGKNSNSFVLWGQQSNRWDQEIRLEAAKENVSRDGMPKKTEKKKLPKAEKKKKQPFHVVEDDRVPSAASGAIIRASDALLCQESVVDYVINATDLKDECDGLKKAFTKNCGDEEQAVIETEQRRQRNLQSQGNFETQNPLDVPNPVQKWQYRLHCVSRSIQRWFEPKPAILMLEDEIISEWDNSAFEVRQGWDLFTPKLNGNEDTRSRRMVDEAKAFDRADKHLDRQAAAELDANALSRTSATDSETKTQNKASSLPLDDSRIFTPEEAATRYFSGQLPPPTRSKRITSESPNATTPTKTSTAKETTPTKTSTAKEKPKSPNLSLPTKLQHVSGKMLDETLLLQQEDKVMADVRAARDRNKTASSSTAEESAAASAKAVSDTVDLVSTVLNDPNLVEARTCCASILNVFHENCNVDEDEEISDSRLFVGVAIIALCGLVKSLIRHFHVRWLPEAAGCILVGVAFGWALSHYPHHDFSFNGSWFLRIMVPPIVFEAALSINKRSFNRHVVPILIYAVAGTLLATVITAFVVHNGSKYFHGFCETIPLIESLAFGSLISSIDPIAVLSVLSNMGMTDTDSIYVVIFGESLLNDGVAIVLFQTLVHFLDVNIEVDGHALVAAAIHFCVVAIGSLLVGLGSGLCSTLYYWMMHGCQTPLVEVLMFCCWALLPYYICDGIEWSGIVAVVTAGFVMDINVVGIHNGKEEPMDFDSPSSKSSRSTRDRKRRAIFSSEGHLSREARTHIGFVTEIIATMMETAIFAYLGLFLFNTRYHWNYYHTCIAIAACCISRAIMIPSLSTLANSITRIQQVHVNCENQKLPQLDDDLNFIDQKIGKPAGVVIDRKMQLVLWFAGLRGAMSFALVENIPLYDAVTGEGTRFKSELKAMTSACIIFTVFILGGSTYYMMESLGMAPSESKPTDQSLSNITREMEMIGLLSKTDEDKGLTLNESNSGDFHDDDYDEVPDATISPSKILKGRGTFRQRNQLS